MSARLRGVGGLCQNTDTLIKADTTDTGRWRGGKVGAKIKNQNKLMQTIMKLFFPKSGLIPSQRDQISKKIQYIHKKHF